MISICFMIFWSNHVSFTISFWFLEKLKSWLFPLCVVNMSLSKLFCLCGSRLIARFDDKDVLSVPLNRTSSSCCILKTYVRCWPVPFCLHFNYVSSVSCSRLDLILGFSEIIFFEFWFINKKCCNSQDRLFHWSHIVITRKTIFTRKNMSQNIFLTFSIVNVTVWSVFAKNEVLLFQTVINDLLFFFFGHAMIQIRSLSCDTHLDSSQ